MHERCIRIGSAGKTFSLTAWKVHFIKPLLFKFSLTCNMNNKEQAMMNDVTS